MDGQGDVMACIRVDDEFGRRALCAQRVPELERLWRGAFSVAIANHRQGWSSGAVDEVDGGAFRVDVGIVVDGGAEVGNHPLVDRVFAVIALPVGNSGARASALETLPLLHAPHLTKPPPPP